MDFDKILLIKHIYLDIANIYIANILFVEGGKEN